MALLTLFIHLLLLLETVRRKRMSSQESSDVVSLEPFFNHNARYIFLLDHGHHAFIQLWKKSVNTRTIIVQVIQTSVYVWLLCLQ